MGKDVRRQLAAAEVRLGELSNRCDELHEENAGRVARLAGEVAAGGAVEGDLLRAQVDGENLEMIGRKAVLSFEAGVVEPLRRRVEELDLAEMVAEARRLDGEAAAARGELEGFLRRAGEEERVLRGRVCRAEEGSAGLQRRAREMRRRLSRGQGPESKVEG